MRLKFIYLLALALALAPPGGEVLAQVHDREDSESPMLQEMRDLYGDEAFITIATGSRKPIYRAPAVASVITAAEIKAMGARSLDEVLETVAGLHVMPSALNRLDSIYSIRGIHTGFNPHVLVLMNGLPFTNLFNGGRPFVFRLPVTAITRIEVIRGPGSAVYGADAFAGVINIITKDAREMDGTEIGGRVGSFDTHDLWLQHGRTWAGLDVALTLEWQESAGDKGRRIEADLQTTLDSAFDTSASRAPGPLSTRYDVLNAQIDLGHGNWRLKNWYWRQDDAGQGAGGAQALDHTGGQHEDLYLADLTYTNSDLFSDWSLSANLNYVYNKSDSKFVLLPPESLVPLGNDGNLNFTTPERIVHFPEGVIGNPGGTGEQVGIDLTTIYLGHINHRWRIGTGFRHQSVSSKESRNFGPGVLDEDQITSGGSLTPVTGTSYVFLPNKSRKIYYLSVQDEWQFARNWELTSGIRVDRYSDFGSSLNPRLALVWVAQHNLTAKLLYGRAFRSPSFSEQFAINNPVVLGNPTLSPETVDTLELSFDYRPTFDLQTTWSLFAYKAKDLIEFIQDTGGDSHTAQNARDQQGYGFEFEARWIVTDTLRLRGNYAWQHSEDANTNNRIPDAPSQQLYLSADWQFVPDWHLYPQVTWVGGRKRAHDDPRPEIDDYALAAITVRRNEIFKHWNLTLSVRNLFDEDAREPSSGIIPADYPLEGRSFIGELSYRF